MSLDLESATKAHYAAADQLLLKPSQRQNGVWVWGEYTYIVNFEQSGGQDLKKSVARISKNTFLNNKIRIFLRHYHCNKFRENRKKCLKIF